MFDRLIHDLRRPLYLIRVAAQEARLDVARDRLDPASLPASMEKIEQAVELVLRRIDELETALERAEEEHLDGHGATTLEAAERRLITRALQRSGGNKKRAAQSLGISRFALQRRLDKIVVDVHGNGRKGNGSQTR